MTAGLHFVGQAGSLQRVVNLLARRRSRGTKAHPSRHL